jgi:hypothetical protein
MGAHLSRFRVQSGNHAVCGAEIDAEDGCQDAQRRKEKRSSFLKKRSKKLLLAVADS